MLVMLQLQINSTVQLSERTHEGKDYIVAPVVILVEGVHKGPGAAMFYPREEMSKFPKSWNGRPLVLQHPTDNSGTPISASDPQVLEARGLGKLFNVQYTETQSNPRLIGELWIDTERVKTLSPEVLTDLRAGKLEVSTGMFTENDGLEGMWNNESFAGTARAYRPDHLALLPGGKGACSIADGCGAPRINSALTPEQEAMKTTGFTVNEVSHEEIRSSLQKEIDKLDRISQNSEFSIIHYIKEVFEKDFVYTQSGPDGVKFLLQTYISDDAGNVTLGTDVTEVREVSEYVPITINDEGGSMEKTVTPCCPEKVSAIIINEASPYKEDDREFLSGLSEEGLGKIELLLAANKAPEPAPEKKIEPAPTINTDSTEQVPTIEEFLKGAPAALSASVMAMHADHLFQREELITAITTNESSLFTKEELGEMPTEHLRKLSAIGGVKSTARSFAGQGGGPLQANAAAAPGITINEEIMETPVMTFGKEVE